MAKIHPEHPAPETPNSELKVFAALRDKLPDDYTIFHGQRINTSDEADNTGYEGEADFVIFHPELGYIVLEVKGGGIRHDAEGWWSTGNNGEHRIKDPGHQAQGQSHAINKYLRSMRPYSKEGIRFGWAVCFPDMRLEQLQIPELPRSQVIDAEELVSDNLSETIERIFQHIPAAEPSRPYNRDTFAKAIAPSLNLVPSLSDKIRDEALQLVRLTEEQFQIIEFMGANPCVAIRGGAGTGKTMIAIERGRRLAATGESVLMLCYNEPLARYLSEQAEGVHVATFYQLCKELAAEAGLPFEVPADIERQRVFWQQGAQYKLDQALKQLPDARWDHIIVDEAQDFLPDWWTTVLDLKRSEESTLWVLFDPNQNLYACDELTKDLDAVRGDLTTNCRNTRNIGNHLDELIPNCTKVRDEAPEGEPVSRTACPDPDEMLNATRKTLHTLLNDNGIKPDDVVILSPRLPETSTIWSKGEFGNWRLRLLEDDPEPNTVRFSSVHKFKGLEADAVILCELEPGTPGCKPMNLYVGGSRARHLLYEISYVK